MPSVTEYFDEEEKKRFRSLGVSASDHLVSVKYSVSIHKDFIRGGRSRKKTWPPKYWEGTLEEWETLMNKASDALDDVGMCTHPSYSFNLFHKISVERWAAHASEAALAKVKAAVESFRLNEAGAYETTLENFEGLKAILKNHVEEIELIAKVRQKFVVPLESDGEKITSSDLELDDPKSEATPEPV